MSVVVLRYNTRLPAAKLTGTLTTGTLLLETAVRSQPISSSPTCSSTVYQAWRQLMQRRCRVTWSACCPLVQRTRT